MESESSEESIKFMDETESSEDEKVVIQAEKILDTRFILDYVLINTKNYKFKTWSECFGQEITQIKSLLINTKWRDFFDSIETNLYYSNILKILSNSIHNQIVPHAELVFNSLNIVSPKNIRVVFIGQDPYYGVENINGQMIPQAMGICFSVPFGFPISASLKNIYKNLLEYRHIRKLPDNGFLIPWALQGCLMINASLTTLINKANAHRSVWNSFTIDLIKYISDMYNKIVFVAWGHDAHVLCHNVDPYKHHIITSSHPSPLSCDKTFKGTTYIKQKNTSIGNPMVYPSFRTIDHFGEINKYLKSKGKHEIIWDLLNDIECYHPLNDILYGAKK
jgi:uracil-DNA glycosylase